MRPEEIERLDRFEDSYWWHTGRRRIVTELTERYLGRGQDVDILDVGCGTGRNVQLLSAFGRAWGVDRSPVSLAAARRRGLGDRVSCADATRLPFADGAFDMVSALDVIEHLDDDAAALAELERVLAPGGLLLLAVPAYRFLWSEHDEALGHRRRYTGPELEAKTRAAGFDVQKRSHAITFAFPIILSVRLFNGMFPRGNGAHQPTDSYVELPGPVNRLFELLVEQESRMMRRMNLPFGTSIFLIARKPGSRG